MKVRLNPLESVAPACNHDTITAARLPRTVPPCAAWSSCSPPSLCSPAPRARAGAPSPAEAEFFEKQIRPLLAERRLNCHDAKKSRGGLQLTSRDLLLQGGDSGPAAVAGQPDKSLLIKAVRYTDDLKMPPKEKLNERQIALLTALGEARSALAGKRWSQRLSRAVRSGSLPSSGRFWSFQPVANPAAPKVKETAWPRSDLDRFILAKLEAKSLRPARPADKRTLIRRATFDLTGLPPTPEEVDAFLRDNSPDAFAGVIDRLLASPSYGERWGRHWLDLVRYTDSFDARGIGGEMALRRRLALSRLGGPMPSTATCPTTASSAIRSPAILLTLRARLQPRRHRGDRHVGAGQLGRRRCRQGETAHRHRRRSGGRCQPHLSRV